MTIDLRETMLQRKDAFLRSLDSAIETIRLNPPPLYSDKNPPIDANAVLTIQKQYLTALDQYIDFGVKGIKVMEKVDGAK
ncbi:MAG: hypothetical protein MUO73_01065 [Thermoplasmata archaeon]|nr:hypothetical protein [Thermoplasmata archaeon]